MGRRRIHAAFILYKTLGYPELGYLLHIDTTKFFGPVINYDTHNVKAEFKVDNNDIATVTAYGFLKFKRPGTVVLTATCSASENCAKAQCSTTVTTKRDGVTFTSEGLPDVIFNNTSYCIRNYLYNSKTKSGGNFHANGSFSVTSSNNAILRYDDLWLKFSGTAGEAPSPSRRKRPISTRRPPSRTPSLWRVGTNTARYSSRTPTNGRCSANSSTKRA